MDKIKIIVELDGRRELEIQVDAEFPIVTINNRREAVDKRQFEPGYSRFSASLQDAVTDLIALAQIEREDAAASAD